MEVGLLSHQEIYKCLRMLRLFSLKAFKNSVPTDKSYLELSECVVRYCQGNPLALKILGCFLYGRSKEEWKSGLEKLEEASHKDIFEVLRLSFDGLDEKQKKIFLDVCFLKDGYWLSLDSLRNYYNASMAIEISVLKDRYLISVDGYGYIEMHDLVKKMGQEIFKRQLIIDFRRPIRLSEYDDVYHFFTNNEQFPKLKIMDLFGSEHLISLPDLSHAPNIESVNVGQCTNLAQIHSSSFLPKLQNLRLRGCKKPRSINIGSKINGNLGFVAFYKIFDLDELSLLEVSIKVFLSDDATQTCGFELKAVTIPFTSMVQMEVKKSNFVYYVNKEDEAGVSTIEVPPDVGPTIKANSISQMEAVIAALTTELNKLCTGRASPGT